MTPILSVVFLGVFSALSSASARPQYSSPPQLRDSISAVLRTLDSEPGRPQRPRLVTKHDFMQTRDKKSHLELPPDFVVSTNLHVTHDSGKQPNENFRSGRSFGSSRKAKQGFSDLASAVRAAPVVTGVRLPDDETDLVVHRGGRFINNMYVPDPYTANTVSQLPAEVTVSAELGPSRQLDRAGRSYQDQEEGYYNSNEYTFSPLQHYEQQQREVAAGAVPGAAVFPADNEDFVISMQTYQQCPGCPAFSVPVPVPRYPDTAVTERAEERSLLGRLAEIVRPALARARQLLRGGEQEAASRRVDTADSGDQAGPGPIMAGLAAIGMGLASYFSTNLGGSGRKFEDNAEYVLNTLDGELDSLSRYTVDDVLCLPRQYCDQLRGSKHLLDQYPNMKTVAAFLTEKYFQNIQEEDYSHSQCNVRQCLKDLLN